MPTGLKLKFFPIKTGGITFQAQPSLKPKAQPKIVSLPKGPASKGGATKSGPKSLPKQQKKGIPFMLPLKAFKPLKKLNLKKIKILSKPSLNFDPVELSGVSKERPEILMMTDFLPVYKGRSLRLSSAGSMMDVQVAARNLKIENYARLKKQLEDNEDTEPFISDINDRWKSQVKQAKEEVQFLSSMISTMKSAKDVMNVRNARTESGSRTMKSLFVGELQFTEDGFNSFSNTKILSQLLFDMRIASSLYSPLLFDAKDQDREGDKDSIEIDKTFSLNDGKFAFDIENFRSTANSIINMANMSDHADLVSSLPSDPNDRIKLLLMVISKEMRVSVGLSNRTLLKPLEDTFGGSSIGDPFIDIIGEPGDRITDIPQGEGSLSSLLRFIGDDNTIVLPFEQKFITDENDRTYVPGSSYLVDSILQKDPKFDITRLRTFRDNFETRVSDATQIMNGMLSLNKRTPLRADVMYKRVLQDMKTAFDNELNDFKASTLMALFKAANTDMELKSMLFQFMMLMGFTPGTLARPVGSGGGGNSLTSPFSLVKKAELEKFSDFSHIITILDPFEESTPTSDGDKIVAAMTQLAERISNRALQVIEKSSTNFIPGEGQSPPNSYDKSAISDALLDPNSNYLFLAIIRFIRDIDKEGGSTKKALIDDGTGRTRFNQLSITTRAAFAFELYSALYAAYSKSEILGSISFNNHFELEKDIQKIKINSMIFGFAEDEASKLANKPKIFGGKASPGLLLPTNQTGKNLNITKIEEERLQQIYTVLGTFGGLLAVLIFTSLNDISRKLRAEDDFLRTLVAFTKVSMQRTKGSLNKLIKFFKPNGPNKNALADFSTGPDANEKAAMLSEAQVNLAQAEVNEMDTDNIHTMGRPRDPVNPLKSFKSPDNKRFSKPFLDDSDVPARVVDAMYSLFRRSKYRDKFASDVKILTVGIPAGFMAGLRARVDVDDSEPDDFSLTEDDVISINVYKRDLELEDVVFKPKRFIFEMSRFVARSKFATSKRVLANPWNFQKNFDAATGKLAQTSNITVDERYSFLEPEDRFELSENHMISYLLGTYIKVMTGISTKEIDYLANQDITSDPFDDETRTLFRNLVDKHISGLAGKTLTLESLAAENRQFASLLKKLDNFEVIQSSVEQINNVSVDAEEGASIEVTQDIIDFMSLFSPNSFLAGVSARRKKALSPKLFERIFSLPVDPGEFDIDEAETNSTKFGRIALANLQTSRQIIKATNEDGEEVLRVLPKTTRDNSVVYDEFFVTISTVGGQII
jgi:hypothetical protein